MAFTVASNSFKDGDYLPGDFILSADFNWLARALAIPRLRRWEAWHRGGATAYSRRRQDRGTNPN